MEKNGMLTSESLSDFDNTKKAAYYDAEGYAIADASNKHKLKNPKDIKELTSASEQQDDNSR